MPVTGAPRRDMSGRVEEGREEHQAAWRGTAETQAFVVDTRHRQHQIRLLAAPWRLAA